MRVWVLSGRREVSGGPYVGGWVKEVGGWEEEVGGWVSVPGWRKVS